MFAVIKAGGKQYRVAKGDIIEVNKLDGKAGETITLSDLLMTGGDKPAMGDALKNSSVTAEIVAQKKGDTVVIFKKKRRHNYRRKNGHRQQLTVLKVTDIKA